MPMMELTSAERKELLTVSKIVDANFEASHWRALGVLTGCEPLINDHPRLLRSLFFGDEDYHDLVYPIVVEIARSDHANLDILLEYLKDEFHLEPLLRARNSNPSAVPMKPSVFKMPTQPMDKKLVAVMTPFASDFESVFEHIKIASSALGLTCKRAKDIWQHEAVIQDIFELIFRARFVVVDFSGKNPNVMYETGIAHTLGKPVIPITQEKGDIPFDLSHNRYLHYHANDQGLDIMARQLHSRLHYLLWDKEPDEPLAAPHRELDGGLF